MKGKIFLIRLIMMFLVGLSLFWETPGNAGQKVLLNFKGADIRTLVEAVAEATGKNFVLDPSVKGKVTIISTVPLEGEELYKVFLSVLDVHGLIAVPHGEMIEIIPDNQLKSRAPLLEEEESNKNKSSSMDEVGVRLFTTKYVDANTLAALLKPLLSPKGHVGVHDSGNTLLVADYTDILERLGHIIERVDQPIKGKVELVSLHHANAAEIVRVLNNMDQGEKKESVKNTHKLVADERTIVPVK